MAKQEDESNALKDITFGSVAGMASKVFEHPFDLIKVRLQTQATDQPLAFKGPLDCFRQTYTKEGWHGLYRGLSAPVAGAACENATLFLVYNKCQDLIAFLRPSTNAGLSEKAKGKRKKLNTAELAVAAAGAGLVASFVLTPIELIKCRMQVQMLMREGAVGPPSSLMPSTSSSGSTSTSSGIRHFSTRIQTPRPNVPPDGPITMIISTVRTSGLRGLWLGQSGTLLRETGGSSAWFTTYEVASKAFLARRQALSDSSGSTRQLIKADLATYELMVSGALAGMAYTSALFPADSVKSAVQTWAELHPDRPRLGFAEMGRRIWRTRGIRGMYAGCGLTVAKSAVSSAMIFAIYETLEARFGGLFG